MTKKKHAISVAIAGLGLAALLLTALAVQPLKIDFFGRDGGDGTEILPERRRPVADRN